MLPGCQGFLQAEWPWKRRALALGSSMGFASGSSWGLSKVCGECADMVIQGTAATIGDLPVHATSGGSQISQDTIGKE